MTIGQSNEGYADDGGIVRRFSEEGRNSFYSPNIVQANQIAIQTDEQKEKAKMEERRKKKEGDWTIGDIQLDEGEPFSDLSTKQKVLRVTINLTKFCCVLGLLYLFVCSLDLLSTSFRLIAGKTTGSVLSNEYVQNPIVGLMIGILVTVLVQSSSTSTSIIVSMVAAGILDVKVAIPMIMGSNIGTSVTNTIVSLTQVANKEEFRRAFAGATVHDMFNWLAVIVLLIIEVSTHMLETITSAMVESINFGSGTDVKLLKVITEEFTNLIIQLDKSIMGCWGLNYRLDEDSMIKHYCEYETLNPGEVNVTTVDPSTPDECVLDPLEQGVPDSCNFLFYDTSMTDAQIGIILLVISLAVLCTALIIIVKILNSMLKGTMAVIIRKTLNSDIPYVPWLTGYIAIIVGAVVTFCVQSSSIFTSTLTPLIGIGIITVERSYPLTLGSNIGTTTTALLSSMTAEGSRLEPAIQIALVHLFFNIFGIAIFYPLPFMRFPIPMCKALGNITAQYRWFAVFYLIGMFFIMPAFIFALSLGGQAVMWGVLGPIFAIILFIAVVNVLQSKKPEWLPRKLKNWNFLPLPLRSLEPYDRVFTALPCCKSCRNAPKEDLQEVVSNGSTRSSTSGSNVSGLDNPIGVSDNSSCSSSL